MSTSEWRIMPPAKVATGFLNQWVRGDLYDRLSKRDHEDG